MVKWPSCRMVNLAGHSILWSAGTAGLAVRVGAYASGIGVIAWAGNAGAATRKNENQAENRQEPNHEANHPVILDGIDECAGGRLKITKSWARRPVRARPAHFPQGKASVNASIALTAAFDVTWLFAHCTKISCICRAVIAPGGHIRPLLPYPSDRLDESSTLNLKQQRRTLLISVKRSRNSQHSLRCRSYWHCLRSDHDGIKSVDKRRDLPTTARTAHVTAAATTLRRRGP